MEMMSMDHYFIQKSNKISLLSIADKNDGFFSWKTLKLSRNADLEYCQPANY